MEEEGSELFDSVILPVFDPSDQLLEGFVKEIAAHGFVGFHENAIGSLDSPRQILLDLGIIAAAPFMKFLLGVSD